MTKTTPLSLEKLAQDYIDFWQTTVGQLFSLSPPSNGLNVQKKLIENKGLGVHQKARSNLPGNEPCFKSLQKNLI